MGSTESATPLAADGDSEEPRDQGDQQASTSKRHHAVADTNMTIDLTTGDDVYVPEPDDDIVCVMEVKKIHVVHVQPPDSPPQMINEIPAAEVCVRSAPPLVEAVPTPTPSNAKTLRCAVCLDDFDSVCSPLPVCNRVTHMCFVVQILKDASRKLVSTKCGHIFCEGCLMDSMRAQKVCPTCRKKIANKSAYHPIFP